VRLARGTVYVTAHLPSVRVASQATNKWWCLHRRTHALRWDDEPFPHGKSVGMEAPPPTECARLLEDPVRPCKSVAGDTYAMGGGVRTVPRIACAEAICVVLVKASAAL
jgi:hypothetical protein